MNLGSKRGIVRTLMTAALIATMPVMLAPVAAQPPASVKGTVFAGETGTPLTGARLHLTQVGTEKTFTSGVTDTRGIFDLDGLPVASFELAVEYEGGLYVVETPVVITSGEVVLLNLAIPHLGEASQRESKSVAGAGGFLAGPVAATLVVAGSAIAVGALVESSTDDGIEASVFLP